MTFATLVSTEALESNLGSWRVFDCRHDLMKPQLGEEQYRAGHIPGAAFAHMERDLSAHRRRARTGGIRFPTPAISSPGSASRGCGPTDQVVCYDAAGGVAAARLWWMLRWVGHDSVAVLDGGFAKWTAEGRPYGTQVPRFEPQSYPMRLRADMAVERGCRGEGARPARAASTRARRRASPASRSRSTRSPAISRAR